MERWLFGFHVRVGEIALGFQRVVGVAGSGQCNPTRQMAKRPGSLIEVSFKVLQLQRDTPSSLIECLTGHRPLTCPEHPSRPCRRLLSAWSIAADLGSRPWTGPVSEIFLTEWGTRTHAKNSRCAVCVCVCVCVVNCGVMPFSATRCSAMYCNVRMEICIYVCTPASKQGSKQATE